MKHIYTAIPVADTVVLPGVSMNLMVGHPELYDALEDIKNQGEAVVLLHRKGDPHTNNTEDPEQNHMDFYNVASKVHILGVDETDMALRIFVEGISIMEVSCIVDISPMVTVEAEDKPFKKEPQADIISKILEVRAAIASYITASGGQVGTQFLDEIEQTEDPEHFVALVARFLMMDAQKLQEIIECDKQTKQLDILHTELSKEKEKAGVISDVKNKLNQKLTDQEKRFLMREEMKVLKDELKKLHEKRRERGEELPEGEADDEMAEEGESDIDELKNKAKQAKIPEIVDKTVQKEIGRLKRMHPASPESAQTRDYITWLLDLPWEVSSKEKIDLKKAEKILSTHHFGLSKVKERIIEYLAVCKLKKDVPGQILCFVGPPGVGKTSLGQSIATAMGRKFVHFSLAGMRDEAEIRGHRRTYVGALPGRIIQRLRRVGVNNPVFMLDEIDKIGKDFKGDPSSALLEVLDPSQNKAFNDHYLDVPFDLSHCVFITTANSLGDIPEPLLDRMELIQLSGYTEEEKYEITKKFLIPNQEKDNGLKAGSIKMSRAVIIDMVRHYTREAGLRNLERQVAALARKIAAQIVKGSHQKTKTYTVSSKELRELLGPDEYSGDSFIKKQQIGVATGLGWSPTGGSTLILETIAMEGEGKLKLTGKLGEVMKESAEIAHSYLRSHAGELKIDPQNFKQKDVHVHAPQGAIPKDGPSAGITITTALLSLFAQKAVNSKVAMTGEVTLTGKVLSIGGLKEKALAARRAGCMTVIIPKENEKDLQEFPKELRKEIRFVPVEEVSEVFKEAFVKEK